MKRTVKSSFTFLFALTLALLFGIAAPVSAAQTHVAKEYHYEDALTEYGKIEGLYIDRSTGSYNSYSGFRFCGGLWTYEYYDRNIQSFEPMTAYYKEKQNGWAQGSWSSIYTAFAEAAWTNSEFTYCSVMSGGKYLHPGTSAGAVLTFIVPVSGTVSYNASIYAYGGNNTPSKQGNAWGTYVTLYVNDRQVYPASSNLEASRIGSHNTSASSPLSVSYSSFRVTAGDRIRLCVSAAGGSNSAKGTCLIDLPTVTYHQADVPVVDSASAHAWSSWTENTPASCTENGLRSRSCSDCKKKELQTIAALNHNYGTWTVLSEPTCKTDGQQRRTCATCRENEVQAIPAKEHVFGSWTQVSGSCTQNGTETRTCSVCQTKNTRDVAPTGHTWGAWKVTKAPTTTSTGTETATCETCGEIKTQTISPLTGETSSAATSDNLTSDNSPSSDQSVSADPGTDPAGNNSSAAPEDNTEPSGSKDSKNTASDTVQTVPEKNAFPWWIVITAECIIIAACGAGLAYFLILRKKKAAPPKPEETPDNKAG